MTNRQAERTPDEKVMNEVREKSLKTFEDNYAEPPPYSSQPPATNGSLGDASTGGIPTIKNLDFSPSPLEIPTPAECVTHLKLLHAFAKLRHDIGNHDWAFGINVEKLDEPDQAAVQIGNLSLDNGTQQLGGVHEQNPRRAMIEMLAPDDTVNSNAGLAERIRDKRWTIFVTKAVGRFEKWWESLPASSSIWRTPITIGDFDSTETGYVSWANITVLDQLKRTDCRSIARFPVHGDRTELRETFQLPPLDVLMIWHAYMLNPRIYLEDCIRHTKHALWHTRFPWQAIHEAINDKTFEYAGQQDPRAFQELTGHHWELLKDEELKKITCPQCVSINTVPWTRPCVLSGPEAVESYLTHDDGFTGSAFQAPCTKCGFTLTHESLRVGKFIDDAHNLLDKRRPLPGTILNIWGQPQVTTKGKNLGSHDAFFPNRILQTRPEFRPTALRENASTLSVDGLKDMFQIILKSRSDVELVNSAQKRPGYVAKNSRIAVRKLMSHYWDNSSVFGIDLVGAVLRQGTFVQKMKKLDWLHSPGVMSTSQRLIVKYHRFVQLSADSPNKIVVPTLDVDLAWHTHQLTPKVYYAYTVAETKKFLNHDDKIPESNLHTSFQYTSQAYEKKYGQAYSECACWYCECTREPLRSNFLNKFSSRRNSLSVDALNEKGFTKNPHTGPHISSHNALALVDSKTAQERRRELEELDLQYAKVCKRYQKKKTAAAEAPARDNGMYLYGAYGYPMYYPMPIAPYYADPGVAQDHAQSAAGGGSGGCAAGTCAASTSLGACAGGTGTPACAASCGGAGSAAGGCGSCGGGGGSGGGCGGGGGDCGGGGCGGGGCGGG